MINLVGKNKESGDAIMLLHTIPIHDSKMHTDLGNGEYRCTQCNGPCDIKVVEMRVIVKSSGQVAAGIIDRDEIVYCPLCEMEPQDDVFTRDFTRGHVVPMTSANNTAVITL